MLGVLRDCQRDSPTEHRDSRVGPRPGARPHAEGGVAPGGQDAGQTERDAWTVLAAIPGLGPVTFGALLRRFGSGRAIVETASSKEGEARLARANRSEPRTLTPELARRIVESVGQSEAFLARVREHGLSVVTLEDLAYPPRLRAVEMPPHVLFVRGSTDALAMERAVAVVGTRRPSEHGRLLGGRIAAAIARAGACVVSGLAVGIDGAAHAAVVAHGLPTVAVLGGGHAQLYPRAHERLATAIVEAGGAVISELPPDAVPTAGTFPRRNRLISGLTEATVVVEAAARSGALITASWALEQGRECFLVPGPIDSPTSSGCLAFLRECAGQARIVAGIPELLEDLGLVDGDSKAGRGGERPRGADPRSWATSGAGRAAVVAELGNAERSVALALDSAATVDQLVVATGLSVAAVLGTLTLLEMRGLVVSAYGRYRPAGLLAT